MGWLPTHLDSRSILCEPCFSSCRLTEDSGATNTHSGPFVQGQDGVDLTAPWAFHSREVGTGLCTRRFSLCFLFWRGVKGILSERHAVMGGWGGSSPPEKLFSLFTHFPETISKYNFKNHPVSPSYVFLAGVFSLLLHRTLHFGHFWSPYV